MQYVEICVYSYQVLSIKIFSHSSNVIKCLLFSVDFIKKCVQSPAK